MGNSTIRLSISGMTCAACVSTLEDALSSVPGVIAADVSLAEHTALIQGNAIPIALKKAVRDVGYDASVLENQTDEAVKASQEQEQYATLWKRVWVAGIPGALLFVSGMILGILPDVSGAGRWFWLLVGIITLGVLIYSGGHFYKGAWQQLKRGSSNMDTLIALGTGTAWLYSILVVLLPEHIPTLAHHVYFEAALVIIALVSFGQALEMRARSRTSKAIKSLMKLQPPIAHVIRDGEESDVSLEGIGLQEILRVRAGETVPLDGIVLEGHSHIDESMITGESVPVEKGTGDKVTGGTLNGSGSFLIKVSHTGADTVLAQIIEMVRKAQSSKPPIGRMVDKVAAVFVPAVVVIAVVTFALWFWLGPDISYAIVTSMAVLVIACPCALGLATPISIIAGVGKAAQAGVLVRNGAALQQISEVDTVVVDKTGTVTQGKPTLNVIHVNEKVGRDSCLQIAASLEQGSEHPLGLAIREAAQQKSLEDLNIGKFKAITGQGVQAVVEGKRWFLGNTRLMKREHLDLENWQEILEKLDKGGQTPVFLADEHSIHALFGVADAVKEDAKNSIESLQNQGLDVIMLTGDRLGVAEHIARQVGIDKVHAEVLPVDKASIIAHLQDKGRKVAMVGDGINDAPALALADVGIAVGAGTDVAIAASDITLMGSSLGGIEKAIHISKATTRNIWQNLFGAFAYNSLGIPIAAGILYPMFGILLNPMIAGAAMALSSVTVVSNANRLAFLDVSNLGGNAD